MTVAHRNSQLTSARDYLLQARIHTYRALPARPPGSEQTNAQAELGRPAVLRRKLREQPAKLPQFRPRCGIVGSGHRAETIRRR